MTSDLKVLTDAYKITAVTKVETDIMASINASPTDESMLKISLSTLSKIKDKMPTLPISNIIAIQIDLTES